MFSEEIQEKEYDTYSTESDSTEPEDIVSTRQDLGRLMSDQSKLRTRQSELEIRLDNMRRDATHLEEVGVRIGCSGDGDMGRGLGMPEDIVT